MKRKKNLLPLTLCVSLALHGGLFFHVPGYSPYSPRLPEPKQSTDPLTLVNLALIEPAVPPPLPPVPRPPVLSEAVPEAVPEAPAETFIPIEEITPVNFDLPSSTETTAGGPTTDTGNGAAGDTAALTTAYVKRNYEYIQRRIRDKLVFPSQARRAGIQGNAEISFTIHEDGRVSDVRVSRSSGSELLDTAAVDAIYAAAPFRPSPAEAQLAIPINFRLR